MTIQRLAFISVHTSPLAPMGGKKTGGMNVYLYELTQELGKQGYLIDVFTRRSTTDEPTIDYAIGENVRVIYINAGPVTSLTPEEHYPYLSEFTSNVMAFATRHNVQYDFVYSHYWLSGWVAAKLKESWGVKTAHMFHTLGYMKQRINEYNPYAFDIRIKTEIDIIQATDLIVAATPAERSQLLWLYRANRSKIIIVPPGVNIERFQNTIPQKEARLALNLDPEKNLLLFVGRIEPLKAVDTILYALKALQDKASDLLSVISFMVVGGNPHDLNDKEMSRLQSLSMDMGINKIVQFVGAKEQAQLPLYYSASTAVIMPSDYESFGMVALEAMATGTPVIASQVGGLSYLVRDQVTGFHIPTREPLSLADSIIDLLKNPEKTQKMGWMASQIAENYIWSTIGNRLISSFENIIVEMPELP